MTAPLQQLLFDLQNFAADLKELLAGGRLRPLLSTSWHDLRRNRKLRRPLIFTAAVHLGALLLSLTGPLLLSNKVRIPEIYRVELYNAVELPAEVAPVPPAPVEIPASPPPPVTVQVKPAPIPTPNAIARPKAVSLSPIKQGLIKEQEERAAQKRQTRLLDLRLEELDLARQQKEKEAEVRSLVSQAVSKLSNALHTSAAIPPTVKPDSQAAPAPAAAPSQSGDGAPSPQQLEALARYKARLSQHIKPNWQLLVLQNWNEGLSATIVLRMKWDGTVSSTEFEKKSDDYRFDQYVKKAIDNSLPLPPLPLEFNLKSEEIAVTFTPGGLR